MILDKQYMSKYKIGAICFIVNFFVALVAILPFIIKDNGAFSLGTDYDSIYVPLYNSCRASVLSGDFFWDWDFDLGTDFIGSNSFYAIGSPFFWVSLLFYKVDYLYLGGWMFIMKYAIAGMTSGLYMNRFVEKKRFIVIGSVLYAFSGFQSANLMMGGFHDVVAVFPLMLYGVDALVEDRKRGLFAVTVCLNALVNYYFFVGEVIFVIIYFVLRFFKEGWTKLRNVFACLLEGIVGIMLAGVLFYPAVMFILQNPRSGEFLEFSQWILTDRREILKLYRAMLFPGEMMQQWSCVTEYDWSSCSAYLPMVGLTLVICYVLKKFKEHDWLKNIILISFVFMFVPVLGSIYTFMTDVYCRWYYMPLLLFALASIKVMENISQYKVSGIALIVVGMMFVSLIGFKWWDDNFYKVIFVNDAYRVINIIAISGVGLTGIIPLVFKGEKGRIIIWIMTICVFAIFTTSYTCKRYQDVRGYEVGEYLGKKKAIEELSEVIDINKMPYRMYNIDNVMATTSNMMQSGSSFSNVQGSIFELWELLGEKRRVVCPDIPDGYHELVGAKYRFSTSKFEKAGWKLLAEKESGDISYYLYERTDSNTIGVTYNMYMLIKDFLLIPKEKRAEMMREVLVISEEDESIVSDVLAKYDNKFSEKLQQNITDFSRSNNGFSCKLDVEQGGYVLFTIPYAEGWGAYINDEKTNIINSNGFMAVKVNEGKSYIELEYINTDLYVGMILTVVGIVALCGICLFEHVCKRNRKSVGE